MHYTVNRIQFAELEGLAYHVADLNYMRERFGESEPELTRTRDSVSSCLDQCDACGVPFWVQNIVIGWAAEWRNTLRGTTAAALQCKGVTIVMGV